MSLSKHISHVYSIALPELLWYFLPRFFLCFRQRKGGIPKCWSWSRNVLRMWRMWAMSGSDPLTKDILPPLHVFTGPQQHLLSFFKKFPEHFHLFSTDFFRLAFNGVMSLDPSALDSGKRCQYRHRIYGVNSRSKPPIPLSAVIRRPHESAWLNWQSGSFKKEPRAELQSCRPQRLWCSLQILCPVLYVHLLNIFLVSYPRATGQENNEKREEMLVKGLWGLSISGWICSLGIF